VSAARKQGAKGKAGGRKRAPETAKESVERAMRPRPRAKQGDVDEEGEGTFTGGSADMYQPALFIVFGVTGDLASRKLLPALYALHAQGLTPGGCWVLGVGRGSLDDEAVRKIAREAAREEKKCTEKEARAWADEFVFGQGGGDGDLAPLARRIERIEKEHGLARRRVFYLSLPPAAFPTTIEALGKAGLSRVPREGDAPVRPNGEDEYVRLVIEKPFGRDLASARELNDLIHRQFDERQVYRIDHYLGKETVQNLLVFRFANGMFESLWDRDHIDSVTITVAETLGVEQRASYYESAGQLRDMVQSHLTQLLTLVAMEVPSTLDASSVRSEKLKVLRSVRPLAPKDAVLGQYERGTIEGEAVRAYREEPGVAPDSRTETFAALTLAIENWRWQGVRFHLRTGKRMPKRLTEIEIKFRRAPVWMFRTVRKEEFHRNSLVLRIQPDESFSLFFDVKVPGKPFRMQRMPLDFYYSEAFDYLPEAYQTLLLDVMTGDQTLFVHADEVEASWALYAPLLDGRRAVHPYAAGTWGPEDVAAPPAGAPTAAGA
jgi:glucose-6-phosphate 1-dehydrogenase